MDKKGLEFLSSILELLKEANIIEPSGESKVVEFRQPAALNSQLDLTLENAIEGVNNDELREHCKKILKYCLRLNNPNSYFMVGGADYYGLAGSWMADATNCLVQSYELGAVLTLVESAVLKKVIKLFNYPEDSDSAFNPGSSLCNLYGILCARYYTFPSIKEDGMVSLPRMAMYTSEDAHYSVSKMCNVIGLGAKNLILIQTDSQGRMIPEKLEEEIKKSVEIGIIPFCVNATAGTTVLGGFDPLDEIADICKKYNIWLHVDACWGGSFILSEKYKSVLKGIEKSDSLSWNPHKLLGAPMPCSIFLTRHKGILLKCNSADAEYLFSKKKLYDSSFDKGDESILCAKKDDSLKLWIMWKAYGDKGFTKIVDDVMSVSKYLYNELLKRDGFEVITEYGNVTNACFYYIPIKLRNLERNEDWWNKIDKIAPKVKDDFVLDGILYIASNCLVKKKLKNFFRIVLTGFPMPTEKDMDYIMDKIEEYTERLY